MSKTLLSLALIACALTPAAAANQADVLFQKALVAEQTGDLAARDRLIAATLQADPEFKLARWCSGQILHKGQWQSLAKIEELVSRDPRYQEYAERVAAGDDSLAAHADLARWCRLQGLELEAEWHWVNVLRHEPKNREALGALKLRPYRGTYLTAEEIKAAEAANEQAEADFKRYAKLLKKAKRDAERNEGPARATALKQISSINDPAAISALVEVVLADAQNENRILSKLGTEKGAKLLRQLQQAAIGALAEMPEHEATLRLVQIGLHASDKEVRAEAARSLRYREMTSFMPQLMNALAAPIELNVLVNTLPNGQITVFEDLTEAGPLAKHNHSRTSSYLTQHAISVTTDYVGIRPGGPSPPTVRGKSIARVWSDQVRDMNNAAAQIANTEDRVAVENSIREERNTRIGEVLTAATGKELGNDPEAWWNDWKQYNELYTDETPEYETQETYDYSRYAETPLYRTETYSLPRIETRSPYSVRPRSCFVAGTPVWTQSGVVPIEQIKIGDLVLSQDPHTGELNYRPVIDRTVRPPTGTFRLLVGQETIIASRGHRFWTADKGWVMAKFLKAGEQLVTARGLVDLQVTEAGEDVEAYNLEVGEFHTYFVGENRILVHDNTCPQPTTNRLPGVPGPRTVANHVAMQN